jgi:hypothetical protein
LVIPPEWKSSHRESTLDLRLVVMVMKKWKVLSQQGSVNSGRR